MKTPPDNRPQNFDPDSPVGESTAVMARGQGPEIDLRFLEPSNRPGSLGKLGHHEVLEVLGRGAFGIVLKSFDEQLQRVVAVKVLAPEMAALPGRGTS